jgi:hypothetical protein
VPASDAQYRVRGHAAITASQVTQRSLLVLGLTMLPVLWP